MKKLPTARRGSRMRLMRALAMLGFAAAHFRFMTIHTTVIPAAGLGTRMLPAAKAVPKELLPILDRPTIQYVLEEAADLRQVRGPVRACLAAEPHRPLCFLGGVRIAL